MCDTCVELDRKIAHYQRLASRFTDQGLLDGIKELIEGRRTRRLRSTRSERSKAGSVGGLLFTQRCAQAD
jgi:hypothetical protein